MTENDLDKLSVESTTLRDQLQQLSAFKNLILTTATILDLSALLTELSISIANMMACKSVFIFVADDEDASLKFGASNIASPPKQSLRNLSITVFNAENDPLIGMWLIGQNQLLDSQSMTAIPALKWLADTFNIETFYSVPLLFKDQLIGLVVCDHPDNFPESNLKTITEAAAIVLQNARIHSETVEKSTAGMHELYILRQIDRELNDNIDLNHVFSMTLDWALRFTNAQAASVELYDEQTDELRMMAQYGHDVGLDTDLSVRLQQNSIAYRVARSGRAEVIPDVSMDADFVRVSTTTQSEMAIPVIREDRVIAVITIESRKLNGFTDAHLDFVEKLASRAAVAIDNARLFAETKREREKLSHILSNTADIVIVCSMDDRLILINQAAISALRLYTSDSYLGRPFLEVFSHTTLTDIYRKSRASGEPVVSETVLPNDRIYHVNITLQENVGCIIVMHDITPFKEMDRLKSDLIATVSHDLKQPLAVMNGYTELLMMHKKLDTTGINFIEMVRKSIHNMRQLIDDLLDLGKIESGIKLDFQATVVKALITECVESLRPTVLTKNMTLTAEIPDTLPPVYADRARLQQILANLIGNAVKYTQPEGWVKVNAEERDTMLRITVQDNGMGISPEDQIHIFDRFYRVRRPETDSIEGTGLGLAIVKSLVEAHNGQIGLESRLGEGTTFYLLLPIYRQDDTALEPTA
jgi:signal transduction histidine kinase